jgi:hypothetical protein
VWCIACESSTNHPPLCTKIALQCDFSALIIKKWSLFFIPSIRSAFSSYFGQRQKRKHVCSISKPSFAQLYSPWLDTKRTSLIVGLQDEVPVEELWTTPVFHPMDFEWKWYVSLASLTITRYHSVQLCMVKKAVHV